MSHYCNITAAPNQTLKQRYNLFFFNSLKSSKKMRVLKKKKKRCIPSPITKRTCYLIDNRRTTERNCNSM